MTMRSHIVSESNVAMTRKCLTLICDIAGRGARADDPNHVGYALQELSQVILERTGTERRLFEPASALQMNGLEKLEQELSFVNDCAADMASWEPDTRRSANT